jgi:hypothetical protein
MVRAAAGSTAVPIASPRGHHVMTETPLGAPARARAKRSRLIDRQTGARAEGPVSTHWRTYFLEALAATSNVSASARAAGVSPSRAYKTRREHADFAAAWRGALYEGYEHLEMEVLASLRGHDPDRKLDITSAIRLLAAHREAIATERAKRHGQDEAEVFASLEAKLATIRERLAKDGAASQTDGGDGR